MGITLRQAQGCTLAAAPLSEFLPASGAQQWKGHVTFASVARDVGLGGLWQPRSNKLESVSHLLQETLSKSPHSFERLVLAVLRAGLSYRAKRNDPITREEIEALNAALQQVGFRFPDLWDQDFLRGLPSRSAEPPVVDPDPVNAPNRAARLASLASRFYGLWTEPDRQVVGYALEDILNDLSALFGLAPRQPFRVVGEQIDGSLDLDREIYLVEAKWTRARIAEDALLTFRGKIEGKSSFTRGVFISVSGFTGPAVEAITRGKQPTFVLVDGDDLVCVLEGQIDFDAMLRHKVRTLAETGAVLTPARAALPA